MPDKFPTAFYEAHEILTCPNGDKLRSDDEGLFCLVDGDRVPASVVNGIVVTEEKPKAKAKGSKGEVPPDANG